MIEKIKDWLGNGEVDVFLGYRMVDGHPLPHVFSKERLNEVDAFIVGTARYPLEKIATMIASDKPDIKIGMVARDCNRRTLNVLYIWNQLKPEQVKTLDVNCCPSPLKEHADCSYLEKAPAGPMKLKWGLDGSRDTASVEAMEPGARFDKWMYEFEKCIKCYGCRNICPVCFCRECSLEHSDLVGTGGPAAGGAYFSSGAGDAYGGPVHRLRPVRRRMPHGHTAEAALPEGQRHRPECFSL